MESLKLYIWPQKESNNSILCTKNSGIQQITLYIRILINYCLVYKGIAKYWCIRSIEWYNTYITHLWGNNPTLLVKSFTAFLQAASLRAIQTMFWNAFKACFWNMKCVQTFQSTTFDIIKTFVKVDSNRVCGMCNCIFPLAENIGTFGGNAI